MTKSLYFECKSGISGDMTVAALLDLDADREKLEKALDSMNLNNEFSYEIKNVSINSIKATDFDVIIPHEHHHHHHGEEHHHHHTHRNLDDVNKIIDSAQITDNAKETAKKVFRIVAEAEAAVHNKDIKDVHLHEVGAIDSISDIVSFAVLFDDINPDKVYVSTLTEGQGFVECQHGTLPVPAPAVCKILEKYKLPVKFTDNEGEMVTPTGAAIAAAVYTGEKLPEEFVINKTGYGAGKRPYKNPLLRIMLIEEKGE